MVVSRNKNMHVNWCFKLKITLLLKLIIVIGAVSLVKNYALYGMAKCHL